MPNTTTDQGEQSANQLHAWRGHIVLNGISAYVSIGTMYLRWPEQMQNYNIAGTVSLMRWLCSALMRDCLLWATA